MAHSGAMASQVVAAAAAAAADLRQRGNFEFSAGRYDAAVALYTAALEHCQTDAEREERVVNLCNRSACFSQQDEWDLSKRDAVEAWELSDFASVKAAYRLSKTSLLLKDYDTAKRTIQAALRLIDDHALGLPAAIVPAAAAVAAASSTTSPQIEVPEESPSTMVEPLSASLQRTAFQDLWKEVLNSSLSHGKVPEIHETSIKYAKRPISIKEFKLSEELGHGNFSEIFSVVHKATGEKFALKKIEKKQAADLHKRQHPNVYNEIQMERRVLLERLANPGHPFVVRMYHAFQDYNSLYFLMDLHVARGDLWSQLRYKNLPGCGDTVAADGESLVMMGCHRSTACLWLYELVSAIEYIHSRGIVHRDLKVENILLSATGHVVVIDFGTAKDLIITDLNGPEFVGTPDFMSPEAVTGTDLPGTSSVGRGGDGAKKSVLPVGPAADLWALGAIAFILQTGHTPYWSPSPYLAFLKIKRALQFENLMRPVGIIDDDCWDLIFQLMRGDPTKRMAADAFVVEHNAVRRGSGYEAIRKHPFFDAVHRELHDTSTVPKSKALPIPTLSDLCIRAVAEMAFRDSMNIELAERHPPGDLSKHDLLRLGQRERAAVMHCLDRRRLLAEPRLYARFFADVAAARLDKIRADTRDVVGLTQMNDDQGKPPKAQMHDPYAKPMEMDPIKIVHLTNPSFGTVCDTPEIDEATRKKWAKLLKKCVANINRSRPTLVVVAGLIDASARKILARISDTIPTVVHDGSACFTFWKSGVQCIALKSAAIHDNYQISWLREQLEQVRMSKHPLYIFVDSDPSKLPLAVLKKLARGRALCIFGLLPSADAAAFFESTVEYEANESVDDASIRSTDSEDDDTDNFTTRLIATCANGLQWITVDEEPDKWTAEFERIELPASSTAD